MHDFDNINKAVNHYLKDKSTTVCNTCLALIRKYIEVEVKLFKSKNKTEVEVDDLVSECWIVCWKALIKFVPDKLSKNGKPMKKRVYTHLMAFIVRNRMRRVCGIENKYQSKITRIGAAVSKRSTKRGKSKRN